MMMEKNILDTIMGKKNRGYLVLEGTSEEIADAVIGLQEYKSELEVRRNLVRNNKHEVITLDIAIGKVSEALQCLEVNSIKFIDLETCKIINDTANYLDTKRGVIDVNIPTCFKNLLAKPIRVAEEDILRNKAVEDVTQLVDGLSKEELQKLIERINDKC